MNRLAALCAAVLVVGVVHAQDKRLSTPTASNTPSTEWIQVDGSKNPEMIPQWSVWQTIFRSLAIKGTIEAIPTVVYDLLSDQQRRFVIKETLALQQREADYFARALKLRDGLTQENMAARVARANTIEMEVRQAALESRDRVLGGIPPDAQTALIAFVEDAKKGIKYTVLKADLAKFRLPE